MVHLGKAIPAERRACAKALGVEGSEFGMSKEQPAGQCTSGGQTRKRQVGDGGGRGPSLEPL